MATNMVTRKVRHKNADGTVIEADIGALAENVTEDANHRFVTDAEKEAWNNKPNTEDIDLSAKVDKQGGDIADTVVSTFEASTAEFPVPAAGEAPKTFMGKVKKFFEDFNNIRTGLLTLGQIVNNCTSDRSDLPLAAAQGKALRGQITELYNNFTWFEVIECPSFSLYNNAKEAVEGMFADITKYCALILYKYKGAMGVALVYKQSSKSGSALFVDCNSGRLCAGRHFSGTWYWLDSELIA